MGPDPFDFRFEERNACIEFVQRKAIQAFAGEKAGSSEVSFGRPPPRSIVLVHCTATSDCALALSMA